METTHCDCLVIGSGLAGSAYALQAARAGLKVEVLSLGSALQANSDWAQGGIIYDTTPEPDRLAQDIVAASGQTSNPEAVAQLVREGPAAVRELLIDELGVGFVRDAAGRLDFAREGGHSERRIIHARDATGHAILEAVARCVDATPGVVRRSGWIALDLLTLSHNARHPVEFTVEVDFYASGQWHEYRRFTVQPGERSRHRFPAGYGAHWVRVAASASCTATAQLHYE